MEEEPKIELEPLEDLLPPEETEEKKELTEFRDDTKEAKTKIITTTIRDTWQRFIFLGLCCFSLLGAYFCYDNPAPVEKKLKAPVKYRSNEGTEYGMGLSDIQYQLLYSLYHFPNILIPLFGGFFLDRLGKRQGLIIFAVIITVGQFFFSLSTHAVRASKGFGQFLMILSRFVFGLGGENLNVAETAFAATWFKGKELSLALGIDLCVSRLSGAINDVTQPAFYKASGNSLNLGFWFGFILCLLSIGSCLVLVYLDIKADKTCIQLEVPIEQQSEPDEREEDEEIEDKVKLSDLKKFSLPFWLLTGTCMLTYMSFMTFMNVSSDFLQNRFRFSLESAGVVMSIPYILAAILSPFAGFLIDKIGLKTVFMVCAGALFAFGHFYLAVLPQIEEGYQTLYRAAFAFVLFGIGYSFFTTTLWPCVPYVVEKKLIGSAYGIVVCVENIGLAIGPLLIDWMHESTHVKQGYLAVSLLTFFEALAGTCLAGLLLYLDFKGSQVLFVNSRMALDIQKAEKIRPKSKDEPQVYQVLN